MVGIMNLISEFIVLFNSKELKTLPPISRKAVLVLVSFSSYPCKDFHFFLIGKQFIDHVSFADQT